MFKVTKKSDTRIDIDLSGSLHAEEMRAGLDVLIAESAGMTKGVMLYRITNFMMPTIGAFGVEMSRLPALFGLLSKFDKCAVLCDTDWIRKVAEVEGALLPMLEIRTWGLKDEEAAEAWLASD